MATEFWLRNPGLYIREALEVGVENFVWDHGVMKKKGVDINRFMQMYYGMSRPWRAVIVSGEGAPLLDPDHTVKNPAAVFPVWSFGDPWSKLEDLVNNPVGLNEKACRDENKLDMFRPKLGQPHRIIITYTPEGTTAMGKKFYRELADYQEEHPEVVLHLHGVYSYRILFGLGFSSVDMEPRTHAAKGKILLPNGKIMHHEDDADELTEFAHWVELFGFKIKDLEVPRNRCIYNIRSAIWASKNFRDSVKFQHGGFKHILYEDPTRVAESRRTFVRRVKPLPDDKFFCNSCSLQSSCKYFRVGAVCTVPDSEPAPLAAFFKTRDSDQILEGMQLLLQMESTRVSEARQAETDKNEINPEVTKMLDKVFGHAEKFVKLVDPSLRAPASQVTNQTLVLNGNTPQELASQVMRILVAQGVPQSEITPEMVMQIIEAPGNDVSQKAIEAAAVLRVDP